MLNNLVEFVVAETLWLFSAYASWHTVPPISKSVCSGRTFLVSLSLSLPLSVALLPLLLSDTVSLSLTCFIVLSTQDWR